MKREEFLSKLGIGLVTVCAGGCLAACGKSNPATPDTPGVPVPGPVNPNFSIDLNTEIKNIGESKSGNGVIVVRLAAGNLSTAFTAVQLACTHEGTSIAYNTNQSRFICPNHGSEFSGSGAVLLGPAAANLRAYTVLVTGNTLTVTG